MSPEENKPSQKAKAEQLPLPGPRWRRVDWRQGGSHNKPKGAVKNPLNDAEARQRVSPVEGVRSYGPAEGEMLPDLGLAAELEEPWYQEVDETHAAYQAFWFYVRMGRLRSNGRVAIAMEKSRKTIDDWCKKHHWRMRLYRYLDEEERVYCQNERMARADLAEKDAEFAQQVKSRIVQRLYEMDVSEMTPKDLANWYKITTDVQKEALDAARLRRPESTTRTEARRRRQEASWKRAYNIDSSWEAEDQVSQKGE